MKIKKGDTVKVITGKYKGKTSRVIKVYPKTEKLIVEGVNLAKKHIRPTQENPQGGINELEMPIHISNVKLFINNNDTRVGFKVLEDGKKVRYAKKTREVIS
jgi:large subunit ribosomal protein L24